MSVASPLPPTAYFGTLSQFSSRSRAFGKGKETTATQASFAGSRFFVAFDRDTLPKQVSPTARRLEIKSLHHFPHLISCWASFPH